MSSLSDYSYYTVGEERFQIDSELKHHSPFDDVARLSGCIIDNGDDANVVARKEALARQYEEVVRDAEAKICKLRLEIDSAVLAICDSRMKQVVCGLTNSYARDLRNDFDKNGFAGKVVADFLRLVKERFFEQRNIGTGYFSKQNGYKHLEKDIECTFIGFNRSYHSHIKELASVDGTHITLEFRNKKAKKHFWICIPLKENTKFNSTNYDDAYLGKYLLKADVVVKERNWNYKNGSGFKRIARSDGSEYLEREPEFIEKVETRVLATDFSAARMSKKLEEYLTTDQLDKENIINLKRCYDFDMLNGY